MDCEDSNAFLFRYTEVLLNYMDGVQQMHGKTLDSLLKIKSTNINLMRFLAAILVIFSHSFSVAEGRDDPLFAATNGQLNFGGLSVAIFFFLSGMYVTKSIYSGDGDIGKFLKKRCERIFPQLWIVVMLSVFVLGVLCTTLTLGAYFTDVHTYLYFLNGLLIPIHNLPGVFMDNIYLPTVNGPLWTMPIEFFGYLVIAVVFFLDRSMNLKAGRDKQTVSGRDDTKNITSSHMANFVNLHTIFVAGLIVSIGAFAFVSYYMKSTFLIIVVRAWIFFLLGVEAYNLRDRIRLSVVPAVIMTVILLCTFKLPFFNFILLICFPYIFLTLGIGISQLPFSWDVWGCSYEMYLVGWPLQQVITMLHGGKMPAVHNFIITLPADILIGYVLYKFYEKVDKRLKKQ